MVTVGNEIIIAFLMNNLVVPVTEYQRSFLEFEVLVGGFQVVKKGGTCCLLHWHISRIEERSKWNRLKRSS